MGDSKSLERTFARASASAKGFEGGLGKASRGALAASLSFKGLGRSLTFASAQFLGGAGVVFAGKQIIEQTSRVQEELEKTGVVFGKNAGQVQAWSKTLAQSFGISQGAALEATGRFGNMLRPLGFGTAAAAKMSERLVTLAADIASFNNAKPEDVLAALTSGLAGQVRPLRQYGVFLSQARIANEAVADGLSKNGKHLSQSTKLWAAYNIIIKDTKNAQGDVARNTESLSVAQSKLSAGIQDTELRLGTALLPTLTELTNKAAVWLNDTKNQVRIQRAVTSAVKDGSAAFHDIAGIVKGASDAVGGFKHAVEILIAFKLGSVLLRWAEAAKKLRTALIELNAVSLAASLGTVGSSAATSAGPLATMLGQLRRLARIATISIAFRFPGLATGLAGLAGLTATAAAAAAGAVLASSGAASTDIPDLPSSGTGAKLSTLAQTGKIPESVLVAGAKQAGIDPNTPAGKAFANKDFVAFIFAWAKAKGLIKPAVIDPETLEKMARAAGLTTPTTTPKTGAGTTRSRRGLTVEQRNQFFDSAISSKLTRAGFVDSIKGQIAALQQVAALISVRLAATKDVTRRRTLEDQLLSVQATIRGDQAQVAQDFISSLQLGVTKAQASASTKDDIAALNALKAGVLARIKSEGDSVDLESQLFDVTQQLVAVRKQNQQSLVDALQFGVTKAAVTAGFGDDVAALEKLQAALQAEIKATGSTLDLQQQLFDNQQQIIAARAAQRNVAQFKALGLTATGDTPTPGVKHLKAELGTISTAISGTFLDTDKTKSLLANIKDVLGDGLHGVGQTVRAHIQEILDGIQSQLKDHAGNLTKFRYVSQAALLDGLGLTPELRQKLGSRLAQLGPKGSLPARGPAFAFAGTTAPVFVGPGMRGAGTTINGDVIVNGVQNVKQLKDELAKEAKRRSVSRRTG